MKVEHITLGGTAKIRDTADIWDSTKKHFAPVGWEYKSQVLNLPKLPFAIKISAADEGCIFDIQKDGQPVIMNVCCFDGNNAMLQHVQSVADVFGKILPNYRNVIEPVTPNWLYSVVVNPLALKPKDVMIAGEVELYIYERLFQAWKTK